MGSTAPPEAIIGAAICSKEKTGWQVDGFPDSQIQATRALAFRDGWREGMCLFDCYTRVSHAPLARANSNISFD